MSKARQLADNGAATPNRNMIINGAMNVAQRSTSVTGLGNSVGYQTVDRVKVNCDTDNASAGRFTMTQTADGPSGFANCLKLACTTADTSIAAGEFLALEYKIEGQDLQRMKKGTSDAEQVTISFYVKGNASATYMLEIKDGDNDRLNHNQFAVTTSWNRISIPITGDTTGALDDDNANSLELRFWLHAGSNYTSGTHTANTWAGQTHANRAVGISSFFDATSRTFFLTGLQMEIGSSATPFEHKTFAQDLYDCQRYYFKFLEGNNKEIGVAWYYSSSHASFMFRYPTTMRATPTGIDETGTGYYTLYANGGSDAFNSVTFENGSTESDSALNNSEVSGTAGQAGIVRGTNASAKIEFDAEL